MTLFYRMGHCMSGFKDAQASSASNQGGYQKIFPFKRARDPPSNNSDGCNSSGVAPQRRTQQEPCSNESPLQRSYIDPQCGASYIRNAGIDNNTLTRMQSSDATYTIANHSHHSLPHCPHNTPVTPKQHHSTPVPSLGPCPCSAGSRGICQSPIRDPTSADMFASQHSSADASLVTIHSVLSRIDRTQERQLAVLNAMSHDTNRLANDSQLFLTANGTFLDSSGSSSLGRQFRSPAAKKVKIFQDRVETDSQLRPSLPRIDTPMPLPLYPGFNQSVRANLASRFDQCASDAEQATAEDTSSNLDDTIIPTVADPLEKSKDI